MNKTDLIKVHGGIEHYSKDVEGDILFREVKCDFCSRWIDDGGAELQGDKIKCINCIRKEKNDK